MSGSDGAKSLFLVGVLYMAIVNTHIYIEQAGATHIHTHINSTERRRERYTQHYYTTAHTCTGILAHTGTQ